MDGLADAGAWLLAGVFAWAALAKASRPRRTAQAFAALGLPVPRALAVVVPLAELAIVGALLADPATGGLAALVTLAFFTTLLAARLARGDHTPCGCFGSGSAAPLSIADIVRNLFLVALAVLVLMGADGSTPSPAAAIAMALAGLEGWVIVAHLRGARQRRAERRSRARAERWSTVSDLRVPEVPPTPEVAATPEVLPLSGDRVASRS